MRYRDTPNSLVFLSSTFADLVDHRKAVLYVLQRMRSWVEAMEYFGSDTDVPLQVCLNAVDRSDLYIGVFGTRYGSTDGEGISITQREYERAVAHNKTILIYLLDEERHLTPPAHVDRGENAQRLDALKDQLKKRHTCTRFESPSDLALKVGLDLVQYLKPRQEDSAVVELMVKEIPDLLVQAGYGFALGTKLLSARAGLLTDARGHLAFADGRVEQAASAGYIASSMCRGDFKVLDGTLTFDKDYLEIVVGLLRIWQLNPQNLASAIRGTNDPMKFRLLAKIAGQLAMPETVEAICEAMLLRYSLHQRFEQLRVMATPVRDVVKISLTAMPISCLPLIKKYELRAREQRKWQQKELFEQVASHMLKPAADTKAA
jgi:hypothetical protein